MTEAKSASTDAVDRELDQVLRPLAGPAAYRDNAFRVTGLAANATPRQVRRSRDERMNPYYVPPDEAGVAPLPPATDADALQHAFEALRDPLLRLTHELLWLRPDVDADHRHNAAVRAHCAALEASADASADEAAVWGAWEGSLRLWAEVAESEETWRWAKGRVREIDDPRLTLAAVWALRERLPRHLAGVNAQLAVKAAAEGDVAAAERHMRLLLASPLGREPVRKAARAAVRPAEARVRTACETAMDEADSPHVLDAVRTLLTETEEPLRVIEALLGAGDSLTRACRDEVATTVNKCAIGYFNKRRKGRGVPRLLRRAREIAVSEGTIELIDRNIDVISNESLLGDEVHRLCEAGRVDAAAARLRAWRRRTRDPGRKAELAKLLADRRNLSSPPQEPHASGCVFFLGTNLYGGAEVRDDPETGARTQIVTKYLTFLWVPVLPLTAHVIGYREGMSVYGGRVPLSEGVRRFRLFALLVLIPYVIAIAGLGLYGGLAAAGIAAVSLLLRQAYLHAWANARERSS